MFEQEQIITQKQEQVITQKQIQSLKILSLPAIDLRSIVLEEVENNPVLEIVSDPSIASKGNNKNNEQYNTLNSYTTERTNFNFDASDEYQKFIESLPDNTETLQTYLLHELHLQNLPFKVLDFGTTVIQNLNSKGFNIVPINELKEIYKNNNVLSDTEMNNTINIIRHFEPLGCVFDTEFDSLIFQAEVLFTKQIKYDSAYKYAIDLLKNEQKCFKTRTASGFLKCIKANNEKYKNLTLQEIEYIFQILSELEPNPGKDFFNLNDSHTEIIPEVFINKSDTGISATISNTEIPIIKISDTYKNISKSNTELKPYLKNAEEFIFGLNFRKETLLKVVIAIIHYQQDFFLKGPQYLAPLRQQDIAEELKMDNSTISRSAKGKYLQCDWGVFEINYFFSNSVATNSNATTNTKINNSKNSVQELIKEIIKNSEKKLSDQKIADKLSQDYGIQISRRTVAKYRNELNIDASYLR